MSEGLVRNSHRTRHCRGDYLVRHLHTRAYTAVVLKGAYVEAGDTGLHRLQEGHVLRHASFESHLNRFEDSRVEVLVLTVDTPGLPMLGKINDPDRVARLAERDMLEALAELQEQFGACSAAVCDWPGALARDLMEAPSVSLRAWAASHGLHPASLSRGFTQQFGITPAGFRRIAKFRRAQALLRQGGLGLAEIAVEAGFCDQPHMAREIKRRSGRTATSL